MATGSGSVPAIEGSNRAKDPWTIEQTIFVVKGGSPGLVVKRTQNQKVVSSNPGT